MHFKPALIGIALLLSSLPTVGQHKPFEANLSEADVRPQKCSFDPQKFPANTVVYAAGAYSGRKLNFQLDQSGHTATQFDVAVNSPTKPVALMLGAYEPSIWNIGWSKGTKIVAILVSGNHRQVVAGLDAHTPVMISTHDNKGPCKKFYVSEDKLEGLNPLARDLFGQSVTLVYTATKGQIVIGEKITKDTELITSASTPPESYYDKNAPLAGDAGIQEALRNKSLRPATRGDFESWLKVRKALAPAKQDVPPVAGKNREEPPEMPDRNNSYVIVKEFTYPAGLYGAHSVVFYIEKNAPIPRGNPGHSTVFDLNTGSCKGSCPDL